MKPRIRDHIRKIIAERGYSIKQAEREMGMGSKTLWSFLQEDTLEFSRKNCSRLASFIGMDEHDVKLWIRRDARWIKSRRREQERKVSAEVHACEPGTLTWWGEVGPRAKSCPGCRACTHEKECREAVAKGCPLLCERFLTRELIPAHAMERLKR